jgi:4-hydroxy-3-methylbut-2-enyl diphosphate reductase
MEIEIEKQAGFCFGVTSAIKLSENCLKEFGELYCLGELVHNSMEINRLEQLGLKIIDVNDLQNLHNCRVMIRAHGEPPSTYALAKRNNIEIFDATCPIVLKLQKDVKKAYEQCAMNDGQIVIFGKKGHAEVIGLEGQTDNTAIVISKQRRLIRLILQRQFIFFHKQQRIRKSLRSWCRLLVRK